MPSRPYSFVSHARGDLLLVIVIVIVIGSFVFVYIEVKRSWLLLLEVRYCKPAIASLPTRSLSLFLSLSPSLSLSLLVGSPLLLRPRCLFYFTYPISISFSHSLALDICLFLTSLSPSLTPPVLLLLLLVLLCSICADDANLSLYQTKPNQPIKTPTTIFIEPTQCITNEGYVSEQVSE